MNMNSISRRNINEQEKLCKTYEIAAINSMKRAGDEVASSPPTHQSGILLPCAKVDGAWQKCGHSSANGVVNDSDCW